MVNKDLKKNSKIRTVNMMIQSALIIILIVLVVNMMVEIKNLQGTARVINYAGLVRGATQRAVKLEVIGNSDDELIEYLDDVLADLKYEDGKYNLVSLRDTDYQKKLDIQIDYWGKLKNEINNVRENGVDNSDIVDMSEMYFSLADQTVSAAERYSEGIADNIHFIETITVIDMAGLLLLIIIQMMQAIIIVRKNKVLEQKAYLDAHTGLPNKSRCEEVFHDLRFLDKNVACIMFDLNNLKTAAYEKQQAEVEEESRMKSLEQLAGTLMNEGKGASDTGEKEKDGDRLQQSVNTYEQISGQLNDFYETPKETANSDLERKVDELNKKLEEAEKEKNKAATREELMERSYKMAAKYLNPDKDTVQEKAVGKEPTETVPVQRAEYQTTSGLSQPVTDSAYIASLTVERNYGFNTAVGNSYQMGTNTIAACISENQIIEQGGRVKLRLLQPLQAGNITVPENSLVTGAAVIQGERLDILISSIEYAGNIIPVQLATYDIDGQKGIFVPGSETRNAAKDAAGTVSESMGNSVSFARSAGQQVVMDLTRGVMQGGTRLIAGRVRAVKVTLKAGYKVLLVTKRQ